MKLAQRGIAGRMAVGVVERLELVEVVHHERHGRLGSARARGSSSVHALEEGSSVEHAGELVDAGQRLELVDVGGVAHRRQRLVGEGAQDAELLRRGEEVVRRVVGPHPAADAAVGVEQRDHQPVVVPRQRPRHRSGATGSGARTPPAPDRSPPQPRLLRKLQYTDDDDERIRRSLPKRSVRTPRCRLWKCPRKPRAQQAAGNGGRYDHACRSATPTPRFRWSTTRRKCSTQLFGETTPKERVEIARRPIACWT